MYGIVLITLHTCTDGLWAYGQRLRYTGPKHTACHIHQPLPVQLPDAAGLSVCFCMRIGAVEYAWLFTSG